MKGIDNDVKQIFTIRKILAIFVLLNIAKLLLINILLKFVAFKLTKLRNRY